MIPLSSALEPSTSETGDALREILVDTLRQRVSDGVVGSEIANGDLWVRVRPAAWRRTAEVCKRDLGMDYFCFLSGIDWLENKALSGEKVWDPDGGAAGDDGAAAEAADGGGPSSDDAGGASGPATGVAGGSSRFQVLARLYSTARSVGLTLKADVEEDDLRIDSWVEIYRGADWHERETWEMYGIVFDGHPGLRHMYLPGEFEGYPLRKDFPLLAREVKPWPGLVDVEAMPGEDEAAADDTSAQEAEG